jgi:hypothetical protein
VASGPLPAASPTRVRRTSRSLRKRKPG